MPAPKVDFVDAFPDRHQDSSEVSVEPVERYFILDERGEPVPEPDCEKWQRWTATNDCGVARTAVSREVTVLTVFQSVDTSPSSDELPKLFETRIFGGILDGEDVTHRTRAEAIAAHQALVRWCRLGNTPDMGSPDKMIA